MSDEGGTGTSAGALLRAARERQGLHIAALAAAIKVSPRKLDALENDRWDELPDATFARALAQTVCRTLKIDARPVLDLLPPAAPAVLEAKSGGLNTPFRDRPGRDDAGLGVSAIKPMVWAATLLMVAAVIVYLLPEGLLKPAPTRVVAASAPAAAPASALALAAAASAPVDAASAAADAASASALAVEEGAASAVTAPAASAVAATMPPTIAAAAAKPAPAPASGPLVLHIRDASWIEARDANGRVLLSRLVAQGDSVGLDGALPIRLTIGNASGTEVEFQGRPVDLAPNTRDNVARLVVK